MRDGIGDIDYVDNTTLKELEKIKARLICPANMSMAIVGNFSEKDILKKLEGMLKVNPGTEVFIDKTYFEKRKYSVLHYENVDHVVVNSCWMGNTITFDSDIVDILIIGLVRRLLGGSRTSILNRKLRVDNGYVYNTGASFSLFLDCSTFSTWAYTNANNLEVVLKTLVDCPTNLKALVTHDAFRRAINYLNARTLLLYDSPNKIAEDICLSLFNNTPIYLPEELVSLAKNIKLKQAVSLFSSYLTDKPTISIMKRE